jgi:hypothetical protein
MRKAIILAALALLAVPGTASSADTAWGIAAFGGPSFPIGQDDNNGSGVTYGVRFPAHFGFFLSVEPHFDWTNGGETEETFNDLPYTRDGIDVKQAGMNFILGNPTGSGFRIYPYVGIGHYSLKGEGREDLQKIGYNGGLGIGFGSKLKLDVRGDYTMIDIGLSSRKAISATAGLGLTINPND